MTISQTAQPAAEAGSGMSSFLIGAIIITVIIIVVMLLIGLIIYFLVKFWKQKSDLLLNIRKMRIAQCSEHKTLPAKGRWFIWTIKKNPKIRTSYLNQEGEYILSKPIAYYAGHCWTNDGNMVIAIYQRTSNIFFLFPKKQLLIINDQVKRTLKYTDDQGNATEKTWNKLMTARDIVKIHPETNEVIIQNCKGIMSDSKEGFYFIPVLINAEETTMDLSSFALHDLREVATVQMYQTQLALQNDLNRKAVGGNPQVRIHQQTDGSSGNQAIEQGRF